MNIYQRELIRENLLDNGLAEENIESVLDFITDILSEEEEETDNVTSVYCEMEEWTDHDET